MSINALPGKARRRSTPSPSCARGAVKTRDAARNFNLPFQFGLDCDNTLVAISILSCILLSR